MASIFAQAQLQPPLPQPLGALSSIDRPIDSSKALFLARVRACLRKCAIPNKPPARLIDRLADALRHVSLVSHIRSELKLFVPACQFFWPQNLRNCLFSSLHLFGFQAYFINHSDNGAQALTQWRTHKTIVVAPPTPPHSSSPNQEEGPIFPSPLRLLAPPTPSHKALSLLRTDKTTGWPLPVRSPYQSCQ
ncbi:unnamed protein product [Mesocestoides corti]|uniref:Uncharacterized protein n=1 Tax=Mesocestoides corti TaxID=53468 RepID=A0A0R3UKG2_MESCO|nr:unnamed protein product [Mesocestoides corti]